MEATYQNGQAGNGETTIAVDVKTTARKKITALWQSLNKKKLAAVAVVGTALVAGVIRTTQWYVEQRK